MEVITKYLDQRPQLMSMDIGCTGSCEGMSFSVASYSTPVVVYDRAPSFITRDVFQDLQAQINELAERLNEYNQRVDRLSTEFENGTNH
jgi:TolA-binding protein